MSDSTRLITIDYPLNPLAEIINVKVDEQSYTFVHQFEVREQLLVVYRLQLLYGL